MTCFDSDLTSEIRIDFLLYFWWKYLDRGSTHLKASIYTGQ